MPDNDALPDRPARLRGPFGRGRSSLRRAMARKGTSDHLRGGFRSLALAALEYAVHASIRPVDTVLIEIEAPDGSCVTIEDRMGGELPGNWAFVQERSRQKPSCCPFRRS